MINQNITHQTTNLSIDNKKEHIEIDISSHKFNLFQQFFIIGLEPKIIHLLNKKDYIDIPEPLIGPKIISKFPNIDLPYINIPDSLIISHCFPKGFRNLFIGYENMELKQKTEQANDFIFCLDNYQMNKNSSLRINKVYYICYFFYEKLDEYINTNINIKKKININPNNKNILVPKVICLSSFFPYIHQSKCILHYLKRNIESYSYSKFLKKTIRNQSSNYIQIEKVIEGLIYNLPGLPRANFIMKISKNNFISDEDISQSTFTEKKEKEIIFQNSSANQKPKSIINYALLMKFFKIEEIFEIIKIIILEEPILFFSENIEYLTLVIQGLLSLIYPFEYHYPVVLVLPENNYSIINLFPKFIFGINNRYTEDIFVLKGIYLDHLKYINIVRIKNRFNNLLNSNEKGKTKNPVIFNLKLNNSRFKKVTQKSVNNSISEIKTLYLKKQNMLATIKEDEQQNNNIFENDKKIKLPTHYYTKCCKKIENNLEYKFKEIKTKFKEKELDKNILNKMIEKEKEKIFNEELTETFLYFFISIFLHYQKYCIRFQYTYKTSLRDSSKYKSDNTKNGIYYRDPDLEKKYYMNKLTIDDLFNCELFIEEMPILDIPFYTKFLQTKMFFNFMKKKIFPISVQDKLDILFFDDKINEKLSRETGVKKIETKFLDYDNSNISGDIEIACISRPFSQNFKEYLFEEKNREKALQYFQYIVYEKKENNIDNNIYNSVESYFSTNNNKEDFQMNFYYFVFPKLLNDGYFYKDYNNENEINNPWTKTNFNIKNSNCLYNQFEKEGNQIINDENILKNYYNYNYTFNPHKSYIQSYQNYIKNLYLQYFSKIFYQISYSQQKYYFTYLMYFIKSNKDILYENSIMMMFNAIIKYGDSAMAKDFFPYIKNKTYTLYLILREKMRPDKDFAQYNLNLKSGLLFHDENKDEHNESFSNEKRSLSGTNINKFRLSLMPNFQRKFTEEDVKLDKSGKSISNSMGLSEKIYEFKVNDIFNFNVNLFCSVKNENKECNTPFDIHNFYNLFNQESKYIEYKCFKCEKKQKVTITCEYKNESDKNYVINTKLYSPLALLESKWFKNTQNINIKNIIDNHFNKYICTIFYFYDQGLLCDFLLPDIITKKTLAIDYNSKNSIQNNKYDKYKDKKDIIIKNDVENNDIIINDIKNNDIKLNGLTKNDIKINDIKLNDMTKNNLKINDIKINDMTKNNLKINDIKLNDIKINNKENEKKESSIKHKVSKVPRLSIYDISSKRQNFFEIKTKQSSLITENLKRKHNLKKKMVGFTNKKIIMNKLNTVNYVEFHKK